MNATDLMVGDWVTLFDKYPAKVEAIGDTEAYLLDDDGVHWHVGYEHIKPIPLTPEILEKNGFKYNPDGDGYPTPVKFYDFPLGKGFFIEECEDGHYQITDHCFIHFRYVHELQHALRLAGVEKEITI